jgi:hypothetical protein
VSFVFVSLAVAFPLFPYFCLIPSGSDNVMDAPIVSQSSKRKITPSSSPDSKPTTSTTTNSTHQQQQHESPVQSSKKLQQQESQRQIASQLEILEMELTQLEYETFLSFLFFIALW